MSRNPLVMIHAHLNPLVEIKISEESKAIAFGSLIGNGVDTEIVLFLPPFDNEAIDVADTIIAHLQELKDRLARRSAAITAPNRRSSRR